MNTSIEPTRNPLALPPALWITLDPERRLVYANAQKLIDRLDDGEAVEIDELAERASIEIRDALEGLALLDSMSLVEVERGRRMPRISVVARPDDHVHFIGPDGKDHWVFVARPVEAPEVDTAELN